MRLLEGGQEGLIDGMTELVVGPSRNPDGRTQYRLNVGDPSRLLAGQDDLAVLTDNEGLVLIAKQTLEYRRLVTEQLRAEYTRTHQSQHNRQLESSLGSAHARLD